MTDPQRHRLVAGGAVAVAVCLIVYWVLFGFQGFDPKGLLIVAGFFAVAWKVSTQKHKRNPLF